MRQAAIQSGPFPTARLSRRSGCNAGIRQRYCLCFNAVRDATAWAVLPQSGNRWSRLVRCMDWTLTKSCSQLMNIFLLKKRMYDYQNVSLATGGRGYVLVFLLGYGKLLWVGRLLRFLADWGARVTLIYMHHGRKPVKNK